MKHRAMTHSQNRVAAMREVLKGHDFSRAKIRIELRRDLAPEVGSQNPRIFARCALPLAIMISLTHFRSARGATWYVIVAGLGGEPDYQQRFTAAAKDLDRILQRSQRVGACLHPERRAIYRGPIARAH